MEKAPEINIDYLQIRVHYATAASHGKHRSPYLGKRDRDRQKGKQIDILDVFQMITGQLILRIFFGEDLEGITIDGVPPTTYLANLLARAMAHLKYPENVFFGVKGVKLGLFKRNRNYLQKSKRFVVFALK